MRNIIRRAISTTLVAVIIVVIVIAAVGGFYYYSQSNKPAPTSQLQAVVDLAGVTGDLGFNDLGVLGAQEATSQLGVNTSYVPLLDTSQTSSILTSQAASQKYAIIICIGFEWLTALDTVSSQYPNQKFALLDSLPITARPNILAVTYAANESSALAGVIAAAYTKTNKIGIVLGIDTPVLYGFAIGFTYGVRWYQNMTHHAPIQVSAYFTGSFSNPSLGTSAANTFISNGADVIWAAAGGTGLGAFDAVKAYNTAHPNSPVYDVGVDTDQSFVTPGIMLVSVLKHVDSTIVNIISTVKAGTWKPGVQLGTLASGLVGISNLQSLNVTLSLGALHGNFTAAQQNSIYSAQSALINSATYQSVLSNYVNVLANQIKSGQVTIPYPADRTSYNQWATTLQLQTN